MNVQDITVDLSKKNVKPESVVLRQGDKSGTTLRVKVLDGGVDVSSLSGYTAKFIMKLPNDTFYYEVEGTISGGTVEFVIDETQAASEAGVTNIAYVTLVNGETTKMSANNVRVEILSSALDGITPPPEWTAPIDEFIEEQTERVDEVVTRATEAAEAAEGVVLQDVPLMSPTVRGGAQLGDGLAIVDGKLTATGGGSYQLPTMSASTKGGAKLGDGLSVSNDTLSLSGESYTSAEKTKLAGVEAGANNYSLPTMGETTKGGAKVGSGLTMTGEVLGVDISAAGGIPSSQKGVANGVASLDANGLVPSGQLPSYVDDVIEGYYYNGAFYEDSSHQTAITGETGKIYVDLSTDTSYRWSGSAYISISNPIDIATQADAITGSNNTKMMTPLRVHQVVTGDLTPSSVASSGEVSATEEVTGGTDITHNLTEKLDEDDYLSGITWDMLASRFTWDDLAGTQGSDSTTENLGLAKPAHVSAAAANSNMDIIDAAVGDVDVAQDGSLQEQVTTLGESVSLKSKSVTANTGANGTFALSLAAASYAVVACQGGSYRCVPYVYSNWWYVTVCGYDMALAKNADVTVTVYYLSV